MLLLVQLDLNMKLNFYKKQPIKKRNKQMPTMTRPTIL